MTVRLLCIDVGDVDDNLAVSAVTRAVAMASSWDRLLCFGNAAVMAARLDKQEREEREGVWLDVAARWLLTDTGTTTAPERPQPGPLQARALVVGRPGLDVGGLQVTERHLEIEGVMLMMAVPTKAGIDAVDNAHLWLVGGQPFEIDRPSTSQGRAVIGLGGGIVGVTLDKNEARIEHWSLAGGDAVVTTMLLGGTNKMSVQGVLHEQR